MSMNDKIVQMAAPYLEMDDKKFKDYMVKYGSPVLVVVSAYQLCMSDKTITPIEELPEDTKRKLYAQAKEWKPDGNKEQLINLCKALWLKDNI